MIICRDRSTFALEACDVYNDGTAAWDESGKPATFHEWGRCNVVGMLGCTLCTLWVQSGFVAHRPEAYGQNEGAKG